MNNPESEAKREEIAACIAQHPQARFEFETGGIVFNGRSSGIEEAASGLPTAVEWILPFDAETKPIESGQPLQSAEGVKKDAMQKINGIAFDGLNRGYPVELFPNPQQSATLAEYYKRPKVLRRISKALERVFKNRRP